jgi:ABC-type nitrate/sulfonate/bicarbonate transport system substrate-binding protein
MTIRRFYFARFYFVVSAFAALVFAISSSGVATSDDLPAITIASSTFDSATAGYYAYQAGLFKKAGLDVTFVPMTPAAIPPAVVGGTVQIASSNLFSVVEAYSHGTPFTVIAPGAVFDKTDEDGYVGLIVRKDATLRSGRDFTAKTIGVPALKDFNTLATMAWIDHNGGDSSTVKFIEIPAPIAGDAVVAGRIDATVLTTPFLAKALGGGNVRVVSDTYSAIAKSYLGLGWITTKAYADAHPDIIAKFSRAIHDASLYVNAHHDATVDMMAALAKVDPSTIRANVRVSFASALNKALIQPVVDVSAHYHVIEHPFDAGELISPYAYK